MDRWGDGGKAPRAADRASDRSGLARREFEKDPADYVKEETRC